MAKETMGERMARVETKLETVHNDINELKDLVKEHISKHGQVHKEMDNKYASKQIEVGFWWLAGTIITALVGSGVIFITNL